MSSEAVEAVQAVPLKLKDGTTVHLRYENRSLPAMERAPEGGTLTELMQRAARGSVIAYGILVWAGLLHEKPRRTIDDVIDVLDLKRLDTIAVAIAEACKHVWGDDEVVTDGEDAEGNAPATT